MTPRNQWCALYARVSTTDQEERYSLPSQLKALREKAAREGYQVRDEYVFVDTFTGKLSSRPAFDRMRALAKTGVFSAVFIYHQDRFARRALDALSLHAELKRCGVKLDFVETPFEDTPMGRFSFTQMTAIAELIGEKIVDDSKRGRREALQGAGL